MSVLTQKSPSYFIIIVHLTLALPESGTKKNGSLVDSEYVESPVSILPKIFSQEMFTACENGDGDNTMITKIMIRNATVTQLIYCFQQFSKSM